MADNPKRCFFISSREREEGIGYSINTETVIIIIIIIIVVGRQHCAIIQQQQQQQQQRKLCTLTMQFKVYNWLISVIS
jgi:heme/copper-type cytochrome/quinol oxidase subunit 2